MGSEKKLFPWRTWGGLNFRDAVTFGDKITEMFRPRNFRFSETFRDSSVRVGQKVGDRWGRPSNVFVTHGKSFGRSEKAFRIRRFMSKFLGVSLLSSASKKRRIWEHGPGTPCKLLLSRSFSKRLERSEKAFHLEVPRSIPFLFRRQKITYLGTQGTYHLKLLFWNSFSEHPNHCDLDWIRCDPNSQRSLLRTDNPFD